MPELVGNRLEFVQRIACSTRAEALDDEFNRFRQAFLTVCGKDTVTMGFTQANRTQSVLTIDSRLIHVHLGRTAQAGRAFGST